MLPVWLTDTVTADLERAVHYTLLWGLEGVELRTVGGASERVPFVNESKLKRRLGDAELPVAAIVPGLFEGRADERVLWMNELATLDEVLGFCERVGCGRVVVSGFAGAAGEAEEAAGALRRAGERAARRGVRLAVLNEYGMAHPTGAALGALLAAVDHPAVGAAWDPAAALRSGEDPSAGLEAVAARVVHLRASDGDGAGEDWQPAPLGEGAVGWPAQLRRLAAAGYDGPVSLLVAGEPAAKAGLRDATRLIGLLRAAR